MRYHHVDVFATQRLTGNGLSVFLDADRLERDLMQALTREMRQFESIFLSAIDHGGASARIFTMEEELPFAGHPVLGAAAVLHLELAPADAQRAWTLQLPAGRVEVRTEMRGERLVAEMDQGAAMVGPPLSALQCAHVLDALGLRAEDLDPDLPPQVLSTGLAYLIVPVVAQAVGRAAIRSDDFESRLAALGAKFVYVLDAQALEGRTWDNFGRVEDVATGSAAGPTGAYLRLHGRMPADMLQLHQGRFAGRPSVLHVRRDARGHLLVSGEVWPVIRGTIPNA